MDKKAMYKLSYGLFVVTAEHGGKVNGCISNTAMQVTTAPNRIVIAIDQSNLTHDLMIASGKFNVSILSQEADFELFRHFGFQSGRDVEKFEGFRDYAVSGNGLPYITRGTNAFLSCEVEQTVDLGTHTLFTALVTDAEALSGTSSCTYEYYQSSIKPKPKKEEAKPKGKTVWRCTVCGYEYEGEKLPEDFVCPWCKHPASDFEKVS